jgi:hypothetical protein|tara:strand:+ start:402 stop:737 length:336 start_codon:yes stop_codon:yes gene_type:complete
MKIIKIIIAITISVVFLLGCQDVKDGLTGKKISKGEEFLIKKKNSLVVPPDFDQLPQPKLEEDSENTNETESEQENIKKILGGDTETNTSNESISSGNSTENSILKKIKKN